MTSQAFLGLDLGTSGLKAVVIDGDGRISGTGSSSFPVENPLPGWAETDPRSWWHAAVTATRAALAAASRPPVAAIGVAGQMHGLVLTDGEGSPLRRAMLWPDTRAWDELGRWHALPPQLRASLANPLAPGMTGPMLAWLHAHEPQRCARARWALLPKDWLRHRLTGTVGTDPADASATLLWDLPAGTWATAVVEAVGLEAGLLPPVAPSDSVAGSLRPQAAAELGLRAGIPVAVGTGDTAAALLATGAGASGEPQLTLGSGAQLVRPLTRAEPAEAPRSHTFRTANRSGCYGMIAVQNAGVALDWARGLLGASWEDLYAALEQVPPGSDGVTFLPYLTGEREPHPVSPARGAWFGLALATGRAQLLRASLEGVAVTIRQAAEALPGPHGARLLTVGGGARDPRMRQLLADVLDTAVHWIPLTSASAIGAAMLAARASGTTVDVRSDPAETTEPRPSRDYGHLLLLHRRYATWIQPAGGDQTGLDLGDCCP